MKRYPHKQETNVPLTHQHSAHYTLPTHKTQSPHKTLTQTNWWLHRAPIFTYTHSNQQFNREHKESDREHEERDREHEETDILSSH